MHEKQAISPDKLQAEARQWVRRLLTSTGAHRQQAASALRRLGVWTRGSVRTRGSLRTPATNRLPEPDKLADLAHALEDTDKDVRCQVALALGEWGGEEAAVALRRMLQDETDTEVQLHCITALRTIGGATAAEGLRWTIAHGTEAVCDAAITAVEELATGGAVDDAGESPTPPPPTPLGSRARGAVRTRGAGRTRGGALQRGGGDVADALVDTLEHLCTDAMTSAYLRQRASEVLDRLWH